VYDLALRRYPLPVPGRKYLHGKAQAGTRRVGRHVVVRKEGECAPPGEEGCGENRRSLSMEEITIEEVVVEVGRILGGTAGKAGPPCG
jgi:hypothetical protein